MIDPFIHWLIIWLTPTIQRAYLQLFQNEVELGVDDLLKKEGVS